MRKTLLFGILLFGFMLGVHEGKIALWRGEEKSPIMIFPYSVRSLPQGDRLALEEGIRFNSMDELREMVADYLS